MGNTPTSGNVSKGCPVCKDLRPRGQHSEPEKIDLENLRNECGYCQMLNSVVARVFNRKLNHIFVHTNEGAPIRVTYFHEGGQGLRDDPSHIAELMIYSHERSRLIPGLGTLSPYPRSTDLDASVAFIRRQLDTCLTQHETCRIRHESPLPTRVLGIGPSDSDIRLVELNGIRARYVTLSHCWGNKQPMRTLASNIGEMKKSINLRTLPIVFQQAISVVRMLKVEYIWIDSLCIIQDSESDWERESAQMCDYYEKSFLTISTAASQNSTIPFLSQRDDIWQPVKLELATSSGRESIYAQRLAKTLDEKGKLFSRAWTWQEAAMSTRTIYFTPFEPIWECLTQVVAQRYIPDLDTSDVLGFSKFLAALRPEALESHAVPSNFNLAENSDVRILADDDSDDSSSSSECPISVPPRQFVTEISRPSSSGSSSSRMSMMDYVWDLWDDLVAYYSRRQLTFATDKLPALSGVASRVHEATRSRYLAGMWEDNLAHSLCWSRADFGDEDLMSLPAAYVAPSWSWASTPGGVEHRIERTVDNFEPHFTIMEALCQVPGLNPFGRVSAGHLVLRGQVTELTLTCKNPKKMLYYNLSGPREKCRFFPDSPLVSSEGNVSRAREGQELSNFRVKALCFYLGFSHGTSGIEGVKDGDHYMMVLGNSGNDDGSFCRVGLASWKGNSFFQRSRELEVKLF